MELGQTQEDRLNLPIAFERMNAKIIYKNCL